MNNFKSVAAYLSRHYCLTWRRCSETLDYAILTNDRKEIAPFPSLLPVVKRKPILLVDDSDDSTNVIDLFKRSGIEYVKYDIRKFEESCCGELPTTKAPSVFAVFERVFKGLEKINEYMSLTRDRSDSKSESESAYW